MTNAKQIEAWDGPMGERWVAQGGRHDRMGTGFTERLLQVLAPREGERILEVGCGIGRVALALGERVGQGGSIVGLDISRPMLAEARRRAAGQPSSTCPCLTWASRGPPDPSPSLTLRASEGSSLIAPGSTSSWKRW